MLRRFYSFCVPNAQLQRTIGCQMKFCSNQLIDTMDQKIKQNIALTGFGFGWIFFVREPALPLYLTSIMTKEYYPVVSQISLILSKIIVVIYCFVMAFYIILFSVLFSVLLRDCR
jgi:hypothetical protein